jgi:hypothetical protein
MAGRFVAETAVDSVHGREYRVGIGPYIRKPFRIADHWRPCLAGVLRSAVRHWIVARRREP